MQALNFELDSASADKNTIQKYVAKFSAVYTEFVKRKGIDIVRCYDYKCDTPKYKLKLRAEARSFAADAKRDGKPEVMTNINNQCLVQLKQVSNICTHINESSLRIDPFQLLNYTHFTPVQEHVRTHIRKILAQGAYAYSCSCGAGKTLAGIYLMQQLKLQTIIISTRNAVNDQWFTQIHKLYPNLTISKTFEYLEADVYIVTPQLICRHLDDIYIKPGLVIYDEIHSMLATKFMQALLLPMVLVNKGIMSELPFMIALSATYPNSTTLSFKHIEKLFGKPIVCSSDITSIPINIYDYYDHYDITETGEKIRHTSFDRYYPKLSDSQAIINAFNMIDKDNIENNGRSFGINIHDTIYKGIVMTYSIYTSILTACYIHDRYDVNVLLVRTSNMPSVLLKAGVKYDYTTVPELNVNYETYISNDADVDTDANTDAESCSIDTPVLIRNNIGEKYDYNTIGFDNINIIVSTVQRLREGFSVQYATWGICTKFTWSEISRVQILGRIRRSSNDEALNTHKRVMICYSAPKPSTVHMPHKFKGMKHHWLYNDEYEHELFVKENYVRI